ncbi:penicillin-binding protein 2 [Chloroflexia bacterium SDU3-3]|nr:penicillin-binding protein 2 [Chloroflexia bacterium SDU3-3]
MATNTTKNPTTSPARPITISRWRINAILLVVLLLTLRTGVRLADVQLLQHAELAQAARSEIDRTITLQPQRGIIRDSKGNTLAMDVDRESLYADTRQIAQDDVAPMALLLSAAIGQPADKLQSLLGDKDRYHRLARWLTPEAAKTVQKLIEDNGWESALVLQPEPKRVYPQGQYAAQVIGAVNYEGVGISGVEAYFDTELKGITGTLKAEWDAGNNPIWLNPPETNPASDGFDLQLTIDPLVQHVIEDEIKKAVDEQSATGGTVIVMDPKTGAIRGLATYPSYDPNRYSDFDEQLYSRSPAVTDTYEPGSTFKMVTASSGLQSKAFTADTLVDDPGVIGRYGTTLSNYNGGGHGPINVGQMLYYSSNVAALQFAELEGPETFYKFVHAYGFGQPTGIEIAGESAGIVPDYTSESWSPIQLDTNAYGQGIAVTPIQMVRMAGAIANGGTMMKPYLIEKKCKGEVCESTKPQVVGQPIAADVAWTVRRMLVNNANSYAKVVWGPRTGDYSDQWLVPGFQVGAKTGTASIPDGNGSYEPYVIGSVLGFAPAEDARYAILVKIDRPQKDQWGLQSSIPVYQRVVEQLMRYDRLAPDMALVSPGQEPYVTQVSASAQP